MEWQLGPYRFCDDKHLLWRSDSCELLEPKQAEVLAYFCRHPGRLISRDEFIAEVWQGQIVTDNAVNRVIARLRKSLEDPAKGSAFIITLPKKGYRFIASVTPLNHPLAQTLSEQAPAEESGVVYADILLSDDAKSPESALARRQFQTPPGQTSLDIGRKILLSALLLILLALGVQWHSSRQPSDLPAAVTTAYQLTPLTLESGQEQQPALSPDGQFLLYTNEDGLMLKDLRSNQLQQINSGSGRPGNGDWSDDGLQYVFFAHSFRRCDLNIIRFERPANAILTQSSQQLMQVGMPHKVHSCTPGSYGNVRFSHDGQSIVFSQKQHSSQPKPAAQNQLTGDSYQIYVKNLSSGELRVPVQPAPVLAGNVEFDLHPRKAQLLIASPNVRQQLGYYVLDLQNNQLQHLFDKNDWLCCPVWSQSGDAIWQTAASPANRILQFGLDGAQQTTIFSSSHDIRGLRRGHDGQSYLYTGWTTRREILQQELPTTTSTAKPDSQPKRLIHSSVSESLPSLSHQQQWLAFVSERSGSREVWLHRLNDGQLRKLSSFASNDWIYDLQWSPDDQQLAVLMSNHIQLLDVVNGKARPLELPAQQIRALSWVNKHTLAMSLQQQQNWQLFHFDLATSQLKPQSTRWAYGFYSGSPEPELLIDQQHQFVRNGQPLAIQPDSIDNRSRRWPLSLWQHQLYFLQTQPENGKTMLMQFEFKNQRITPLAEIAANTAFSVGIGQLYFSKDEPTQADIYQLNPVLTPVNAENNPVDTMK